MKPVNDRLRDNATDKLIGTLYSQMFDYEIDNVMSFTFFGPVYEMRELILAEVNDR